MPAFDLLLDLLGPGRCAHCAARGYVLCPGCSQTTLPAGAAPAIPHVDRVLSPWLYDGAPRSLVLALKLRGSRAAAAPLIDAMHETIGRAGLVGDVVTWVPARRRDAARRGFDHAELLARSLAGRMGLPARRLLRRTRRLPDQTGLSARERWANLRGAFVSAPCRAHVLLVDDVVTTGATASSCARALRTAGAHGVELVVACRAPEH